MIEDRNAGTGEGDSAFAAHAEPRLEEQTRAAYVERSGQDSNRWLPGDGPVLTPLPDALPAELAEETDGGLLLLYPGTSGLTKANVSKWTVQAVM
jgi:hypothetical protein